MIMRGSKWIIKRASNHNNETGERWGNNSMNSDRKKANQ